jgi:glycosyltransferase involved in cell wall biosynthesis
MTILFISQVIPFPVNGGEKLRTYAWCKILSEIFDKVVAVIGKTKNKDYEGYGFEKIDFHEFDFRSDLSYNKLINCLKSFKKDKRLISLFEKLLKDHQFDVVFIDYYYQGQYINYFKSKGIPVIYGTHNVQSKISYQRPSQSFVNKISNTLEYFLYAIHEWFYFRKADALIAVSEKDHQYYKKYIPDHKTFVIPNFLIEEDYGIKNNEKQDYVIMSANFEAFQNSAGLEWFIEKVWTNRIFENRKLLLVGIGSDAVFKKLNHDHLFRNIEAIGAVDDLKPYIKAARVSIVPLLHGSGTRLKCIESMALKTQLLSTSKGAEGIEHEGSIIIADAPELFAERLSEILEGKIEYTEKAYTVFLNKYSSKPNTSIFMNIVKNIS